MYYYYIKVHLAAHARLFLTKLKIIALGEFIPYDSIALKVKETFEQNFNQDFAETRLEDELGYVFLAGTVLCIVSLSLILITRIFRRRNDSAFGRLVKALEAKLFWSSYIRYSLESYL